MPNTKLSDKYKGMSFGKIAKAIESKYEDRFDTISTRGKMSEMQSLRDEQDYQKQKLQIQQNLQNAIMQAQQPQAPVQMQQDPMMASNQGVQPQMGMEQPQGHPASESYNEQFAFGGNMNPFQPLDEMMISQKREFANNMQSPIVPVAPPRPNPFGNITTLNNQVGKMLSGSQGVSLQTQPNSIESEQINPLRYAPLLSNLYNILGTKKPQSTASTMKSMGLNTQIDENNPNQVLPRQTQFDNIDYSSLERGITNQARGFTGTNLNASGGNAGSFMANELGNQGNIMNAISQARLQQQQGDQRTQQLNAGEQARIDQILQQQNSQRSQIQGQNIGIGMQMADLDARNQGAYTSNKLANIAGLTTNLGTIGKEEDQMKMVANALGYSSFGNFMESMSPEEREKALPNILNMFGGIFKSRK